MLRNQSLSRRAFMRAASAAAAAPLLLSTSRGYAASVPTHAGKPLGVGFIGMGKQMGGHVTGMLGTRNVRCLAVCDVHEGRREFVRKQIDDQHAEYERKDVPPCTAYADYHELLARPDIDAVFIVTPDHWHAAIAIEACKRGKDIYCEKPLTLTIGEAKAVIDAVRKHGRVLQTGSQQRSSAQLFRRAVDYIRNGRIGKIKEVRVALVGATSVPCDLASEPSPAGVNWDVWLGQTPQRDYNEVLCRAPADPTKYPYYPGWRSFREFSGGYITDFGAHHLDIVQWALEMDQSGPVEILPPPSRGEQYGASLIYRGSPAGDEIKVTHVEHVYEVDGLDRKGKPERRNETTGILFIGEKGELFVNRRAIVSNPDTILKEPLRANDRVLPDTKGHRENWLKCIETRERPLCEVEIGARSATVCHLLNLAYWNHAHLHWDPQTWEFTGDNAAEANGWRNRARRPGYELPIA
jgi:predicted dehydrogenase